MAQSKNQRANRGQKAARRTDVLPRYLDVGKWNPKHLRKGKGK